VMSPRQIAQLGDSQPHLVVADDRCLAGSTGEHHIAAPANSDKGRSDAPIMVVSISEPSQAQPTASPSRHDDQPRGIDGGLP
jgi:hypothetical protein